MKIECILDGRILSLSINSNKPLSDILSENIDNCSIISRCRGNFCGNCIVLLNGEPALSCLVPAFELRSKTIITFEGFSRSRNYRDIERAYQAESCEPCKYCYNSVTLLAESIINRYINTNSQPTLAEIVKEFSLIKCNCTDAETLFKVINTSIATRRKRNARKS